MEIKPLEFEPKLNFVDYVSLGFSELILYNQVKHMTVEKELIGRWLDESEIMSAVLPYLFILYSCLPG